MSAVIAVMARAPSSAGKSRLILELGTADGIGLRRALLQDTLESLSPIDVAKAVIYTPTDAEPEIRTLAPFSAHLLPQRGDALGERMLNAMRDLTIGGKFDGVVMVGSDLPTLPAAHLRDAIARLAGPDPPIVLGPAEDGGYYLLGLARLHEELFDGIPWGTAHVLQRTVEKATQLGLAVQLLDAWYDVDSSSDLRRVMDGARETPGVARHTCAWIVSAAPALRRGESEGT